jgi:ubiquinone/menaquinone biosynthesis C-methylase UbiE
MRRAFLASHVVPGARVLDVGCGTGELTAALAGLGAEAVGCDVSAVALRRARAAHPELELVQSAEELPFASASFDVVWAGEVLEHVQDLLGLLGEVHRVLEAGGVLLASTPAHGAVRRLHLGLSRRAFESNFDPRCDHVRFFTKASLRATLAACGFCEVALASRRGTLLASARSC